MGKDPRSDAGGGGAFPCLLYTSVLTLGIFYLVVNTLMLYIAAWLANGIFQVGFDIVSFGSAFVASIVISIVSSLMNALVGKD